MSQNRPPILERSTTWEEWERGRAARRAFCDRLNGARGLPFGPIQPPPGTPEVSP